MKRTGLMACASALVMTASMAAAADLPSRAKAPAYIAPAPVATWTGLYIGLNAGLTRSAARSVDAGAFGLLNNGGNPAILQAAALASTGVYVPENKLGFIGGAQIGYNLQLGSHLVAGLEADIQGLAGASSVANGFGAAPTPNGLGLFALATVDNRVEWLGTARARLGLLASPALLVYATGGLAYGGVKSTFAVSQFHPGPNLTGFAGGAMSSTRVGWTAGAGLEWAFARNWSAKAEYLYYDLGSTEAGYMLAGTFPNGAVRYVIGGALKSRHDGHIARVGLNYRFGWANAPVVAKY